MTDIMQPGAERTQLAQYDVARAVFDGMVAQAVGQTGVHAVLSGDQQQGTHFAADEVLPSMTSELPVLAGTFTVRTVMAGEGYITSFPRRATIEAELASGAAGVMRRARGVPVRLTVWGAPVDPA
jgi:hypothetical protein